MPRPARTSLLAVAGLVGALLGITPAQATPEQAVPLFEPAETDLPQDLEPLGRTADGLVFTEAYASGVWVQPTGGEPVLDEAFLFPTLVGNLISEETDDGILSWRTIADPEVHVHEIPDDIEYADRTATGYVGVRGSGPFQVVLVDLLDDGAITVIGTSQTYLSYPIVSSAGAAAMTSAGGWRYFAFPTQGTNKVIPTPAPDMDCPWLSRAHLFCWSNAGIRRISISTGATVTTPVEPAWLVETSTGVAFVDVMDSDAEEYVLKTWDSTASAPTVRLNTSFDLNGGIAAAGSSVLVGRDGDLGQAGLWSIPMPSGTSTQALAAPRQPRRAGWRIAVAPGSVAWTDNTVAGGNLWTRDLAADGTPTGENRLVASDADPTTLSAGAGRFTYAENVAYGDSFYSEGTHLVDGDTVTSIDAFGMKAVLSGDRLLSDGHSAGPDERTWRLRDLRTGVVTPLPDAMDYDLWGERLVRLDEDGRIRLWDLRTGAAPVLLRAATEDSMTMFGTVHIAGDMVAWDVLEIPEWDDIGDIPDWTEDRATRNVVTLAPATGLPADLLEVSDLSTGYVVGPVCPGEEFDDCIGAAIPVAGGDLIDLGVAWGAVDGDVAAGVDAAGMPSVQTLPAYTDAPRLLAHPKLSAFAGPGRTWRARVVASRVLTACDLEIRDAEDAVVRTLDCIDPYAAATVEWDGTDELGEPVPAGEYTWHVVGSSGEEDLVDYDNGVAALSGTLTVSAAPTVTGASPADAAMTVPQNANVTATFSEAVTGVNGSTFQVKGPSGTPVAGAVTSTSTTATLNPTANLAADTEYTATLTGGEAKIRGAIGGPLETVSWSFTTGPAPVLTSLAPATNGTAAAPTGNLVAGFSEAVTGVGSATFELATAGGDPVAGAVGYSSTTRSATFNPTESLAPDTRYTATLTGGADAIRDAAGNPFTTRSWSFTTGPAPTVTGTSPAANATSIGRTANVVAAFSEAMTGVSGTTVKLKTSTGATVSAAVSYSTTSRKVTVNPTATLAAKTKYTVTLTGGTTAIRDAAGNPLTTKSWSFTTGS